MPTIKITKDELARYQFSNLPSIINPLILQLTECFWSYASVSQLPSLSFDLTNLQLKNFKNEAINE